MWRYGFHSLGRICRRQKLVTFINVFGLATGLACCLLAALCIEQELAYDRFHADAGHIYQVLGHGSVENNPATPIPFAPAFQRSFPEIAAATRYDGFPEVLFSRADFSAYESRVRAVDPAFFDIFSFPLVAGQPAMALAEPDGILISRRLAEKYFPGENPLGRTLTMNRQRELRVTGVFADVPVHSTIHFEVLVPYALKEVLWREQGIDPQSWGIWSPATFVRLRPGSDLTSVQAKIAPFIGRMDPRETARISLLPFTERNFFFWDTGKYLLIFGCIAGFVLLIAVINFMNLATARLSDRAREMAVRKVAGAQRWQLALHVLGESVSLSLAALLLALLLVAAGLPGFNAMTGLDLPLMGLYRLPMLLVTPGLALLVGLLAGSYPALVMSAFRPARVLRGTFGSGRHGARGRRILVVTQFVLTIALGIGSLMIQRQLQFMQARELGYDRRQLISIFLKGEARQKFTVLKQALQQNSLGLQVSGVGDDLPSFDWGTSAVRWPGRDPHADILFNFNVVDVDFLETAGVGLMEGHSFAPAHTAAPGDGIIINEAMRRVMNLEHPLGTTLQIWDKNRTIIGVMADSHFQPLTRTIAPLFFVYDPENIHNLVVRVNPENTEASLRLLRRVWEEILPGYPFTYVFVNEQYEGSLAGVARLSDLTRLLTAVSVAIAYIGLFGLAAFAVEKRSREIGIRKVLGATPGGMVRLLCGEYLRHVLLATALAWPLAGWAVREWLAGFAYRADLAPSVFLLVPAAALVLALLTVGGEAWRTARLDPVRTLRTE